MALVAAFLTAVAVRLIGRQLGGRLGGDGNVGRIAGSMGGLVQFRHGRQRGGMLLGKLRRN